MAEISRSVMEDGRIEIIYDDGSVYVGTLEHDQAHGFGTLQLSNGDKYTGDFAYGNMHGIGSMEYASGTKYMGSFIEDRMEGVGAFSFSSGAKYLGNMVDGKMHGVGFLEFSGNQYLGEFVDNKMQGYGTLTYGGGFKYVGNFANNKLHGNCKCFSKEGELLYEGEYLEHETLPTQSYNKPGIKLVILQSQSNNARDSRTGLKFRYPECSITTIDEKTADFSIADWICLRKESADEKAASSPAKKQIIVYIMDHGSSAGNLKNKKFILENLEKILEQIKSYNQGKTPAERVSRLKLNLSSCYGDACVEKSLGKLIKKFVEAGIEVRTSAIAGDSPSSTSIGNGKNQASTKHGAAGKTVIIERVYATAEVCAKWVEEKGEKYFNPSLRNNGGLVFATGEKHYSSYGDLLSENRETPPQRKRATNEEDSKQIEPAKVRSDMRENSPSQRTTNTGAVSALAGMAGGNTSHEI